MGLISVDDPEAVRSFLAHMEAPLPFAWYRGDSEGDPSLALNAYKRLEEGEVHDEPEISHTPPSLQVNAGSAPVAEILDVNSHAPAAAQPSPPKRDIIAPVLGETSSMGYIESVSHPEVISNAIYDFVQKMEGKQLTESMWAPKRVTLRSSVRRVPRTASRPVAPTFLPQRNDTSEEHSTRREGKAMDLVTEPRMVSTSSQTHGRLVTQPQNPSSDFGPRFAVENLNPGTPKSSVSVIQDPEKPTENSLRAPPGTMPASLLHTVNGKSDQALPAQSNPAFDAYLPPHLRKDDEKGVDLSSPASWEHPLARLHGVDKGDDHWQDPAFKSLFPPHLPRADRGGKHRSGSDSEGSLPPHLLGLDKEDLPDPASFSEKLLSPHLRGSHQENRPPSTQDPVTSGAITTEMPQQGKPIRPIVASSVRAPQQLSLPTNFSKKWVSKEPIEEHEDTKCGNSKEEGEVTLPSPPPVTCRKVQEASTSDPPLKKFDPNAYSKAARSAQIPDRTGRLFFQSWGPQEKRDRPPAEVRTVILKALPPGATAEFVASVVWGGPLEQIYMRTENSALVRFIYGNDCREFYHKTGNGLVYGREKDGREKVIWVHLGKEVDVVGGNLQQWIDTGRTRCIRVVHVDKNFSLDDLKAFARTGGPAGAKERVVEGIEDTKADDGTQAVVIRFAKINDAILFRTVLARQDDCWGHCLVSFVTDPCALATGPRLQ